MRRGKYWKPDATGERPVKAEEKRRRRQIRNLRNALYRGAFR